MAPTPGSAEHPQHFSKEDAAAQLQREFHAGCGFSTTCVYPSDDKKSTAATLTPLLRDRHRNSPVPVTCSVHRSLGALHSQTATHSTTNQIWESPSPSLAPALLFTKGEWMVKKP